MEPQRPTGRGAVADLVFVLEDEPELADAIDPAAREEAARAVVARSRTLATGDRMPRESPAGPGFGLLVLEGLLLRDVLLANRVGSEIVGRGDVLQPWIDEGSTASIPLESRWRALEPTRVAVLDRSFLTRIAPWPEISEALARRMIVRARALASLLVISRLPRVEARLLVLFAHLADRWGRVSTDGIELPLNLTHEVIGALVGAQRQTVTTALGALAEESIVRRIDQGWLLQPEPLSQLERFRGMDVTRRWTDAAL